LRRWQPAIAFSGGQQALADNYLGGTGEMVTKSAAPTTMDIPSAALTLKAREFGS
jgi:hypothetical protein